MISTVPVGAAGAGCGAGSGAAIFAGAASGVSWFAAATVEFAAAVAGGAGVEDVGVEAAAVGGRFVAGMVFAAVAAARLTFAPSLAGFAEGASTFIRAGTAAGVRRFSCAAFGDRKSV